MFSWGSGGQESKVKVGRTTRPPELRRKTSSPGQLPAALGVPQPVVASRHTPSLCLRLLSHGQAPLDLGPIYVVRTLSSQEPLLLSAKTLFPGDAMVVIPGVQDLDTRVEGLPLNMLQRLKEIG